MLVIVSCQVRSVKGVCSSVYGKEIGQRACGKGERDTW